MSVVPIVAPSILACDFAHAGADCRDVLDNGRAEWLHVDIMDGHFVPNIALGAPVVASLRKALPDAFFDCHLMVTNPEQWLPDFAKLKANTFTFHTEVFDNAPEPIIALCKKIKALGIQAGISVKPGTPVEVMFPAIDAGVVDLALIMSVEPGFGGQSFMAHVMSKVTALRQRYPALNIQVDGGIDAKTAPIAAEAGANVLVAGTAVFKAADRVQTIAQIRDAIRAGIQQNAQTPPAKI
jgi:ribulose-phosphate 3-epimerase